MEDQNLKQDSRGRVRVSAERREALLDEFERSGLSGVKFAEMVGVKYPTLANWVQKRRKTRAQASATEAAAEQVGVSGSGPVRLFETLVSEEACGQAVVSQKQSQAMPESAATDAGQERTRHGEESTGRPVRLLEAVMGASDNEEASGVALKIELLGGARVVVERPSQLAMAAELIGMLAQRGRR